MAGRRNRAESVHRRPGAKRSPRVGDWDRPVRAWSTACWRHRKVCTQNYVNPSLPCAVPRRHSSAGANPARQLSLQPVAVGAGEAEHRSSIRSPFSVSGSSSHWRGYDPEPKSPCTASDSSPHARGTRQNNDRTEQVGRFIPASARNTPRLRSRCISDRTHPRTRRERVTATASDAIDIPADAGNIILWTPSESCAIRLTTHAHARGEYLPLTH